MEFEGDKPRQQSGGEELPDDPFEIAQAAGNGMDWHNIAIAGRGQRHEAEIDQIACERLIIGTERPENACCVSKSTKVKRATNVKPIVR